MTAEAVREAVLAEDYPRAAAIFDEYARNADPPALADLLEWTRRAVLCRRAHGEARLQALRDEAHVAAAYGR